MGEGGGVKEKLRKEGRRKGKDKGYKKNAKTKCFFKKGYL